MRPDGVFEFRAKKRNHKPYFEPQAREQWVVTDFPCVLLQRTTAKEQSRRLIAAQLPASFIKEHGAVVIENHLNMIRPLNGTPNVSPAVLGALLNSDVVDQVLPLYQRQRGRIRLRAGGIATALPRGDG